MTHFFFLATRSVWLNVLLVVEGGKEACGTQSRLCRQQTLDNFSACLYSNVQVHRLACNTHPAVSTPGLPTRLEGLEGAKLSKRHSAKKSCSRNATPSITLPSPQRTSCHVKGQVSRKKSTEHMPQRKGGHLPHPRDAEAHSSFTSEPAAPLQSPLASSGPSAPPGIQMM